MKILIAGHKGQLGRALLARYPESFDVRGADLPEADISAESSLNNICGSWKPELIINTAAYTAVDRAEEEPDAAERANKVGAQRIAEFSAKCGARLIHISTDFVFDGKQSRPYQPDDPANPVNFYGKSKLAGEQNVSTIIPDQSIILRTAWLYGAGSQNFVNSIIRLLQERSGLTIVSDQIGTPTWTHSLATAIWAFADKSALNGIYHWTDSGVASWYDFAIAIQEEALAAGLINEAIPILPISTEEYPTPATRPKYSVLDKQSTFRDLGFQAEHWRVNLRKMIRELATS